MSDLFIVALVSVENGFLMNPAKPLAMVSDVDVSVNKGFLGMCGDSAISFDSRNIWHEVSRETEFVES